MKHFDVIVIGGGHAGSEAAHAAARIGCQTLLVVLSIDRIGVMSCNPAMGGLAKGQLIREIDALGGIMGMNTDRTAIQYRRLNASKGPAVRSSRAQCDQILYAFQMQEYLKSLPNLTLLEGEVVDIIVKNNNSEGVLLKDGTQVFAPSIVITAGTFLRAVMHTGAEQEQGGRKGDSAAFALSTHLEQLGFQLLRLKTGTPPRLHRQSIDFSKLSVQKGDENPRPFSFYFKPESFPLLPQIDCHITYTNPQTHAVIFENFSHSPLFNGTISGIGPRYCPSIEDKVKRFPHRDRHQIFLEPQGLTTDAIYVNGISTSLPQSIQEQFVHSIVGLENAQFLHYGYAVEYDCIDPRQLELTLESRLIKGLFFAGQINGTSGYEEAGAQGLLAGVNAAHHAWRREPWTVSRAEGYLGVLVDDLVSKGIDEPYRMFTARAEYRLLLREDNADLRLSPYGRRLGLLSDQQWAQFEKKQSQIEFWRRRVEGFEIFPSETTQQWLESRELPVLKDRVLGGDFLKRPEIHWNSLCELGMVDGQEASDEIQEQVEIQIKYAGYIQRDFDLLEGIRKNETLKIPAMMNYRNVPGLSNEVIQRLEANRPTTMGQVSRLIGITPAAVANLMMFIKMQSL